MVYLKTEKLPEINGKCVMIGKAAVPFEPFLYQEKVPVILSGKTIYNVNGTEGKTITPIVFNIVASDGSDVSYALSSGTIPNGITLTGKSISGTPTVYGDFSATVTATSGEAASELSIAFFLENPVVEKYPHDLTSNTSDPHWELSCDSWFLKDPDSLYKAFDSDENTGVSAGYHQIYRAELIRWVRTDGKLFSISSVSLLFSFGPIPFDVYGVKSDGSRVELALYEPPMSGSDQKVTLQINSTELFSGVSIDLAGNYSPDITIVEITVS